VQVTDVDLAAGDLAEEGKSDLRHSSKLQSRIQRLLRRSLWMHFVRRQRQAFCSPRSVLTHWLLTPGSYCDSRLAVSLPRWRPPTILRSKCISAAKRSARPF
jgi:hypothetical protein